MFWSDVNVFFDQFVFGQQTKIVDNFFYCQDVNITSSTGIINTFTDCLYNSGGYDFERKRELEYAVIPFANIKETNKRYKIVTKLTHLVSGSAYECSKKIVKMRSYLNFFRSRSVDVEVEVVKLSKMQCAIMYETKDCDGGVMKCEGGTCK